MEKQSSGSFMEKQLRRKSDEASDYAFVTPRERGKEIPYSQHGTM
jgi:hypothetical protein